MLDVSGGKFGPFAGQFFVADYTLSIVMRAEMEKVNGVYQGACYPFRQGFATGIIGGTLTPKGQIFVGGSKRGWPVLGLAERALQRVDWTGKTPFEIQTMRVKPDGFELRFTSAVDPATAHDTASYTLETFTHHYYAAYGGPEIEQADQRIISATPAADGLSVRLVVDKLVHGHIHECTFPASATAPVSRSCMMWPTTRSTRSPSNENHHIIHRPAISRHAGIRRRRARETSAAAHFPHIAADRRLDRPCG